MKSNSFKAKKSQIYVVMWSCKPLKVFIAYIEIDAMLFRVFVKKHEKKIIKW